VSGRKARTPAPRRPGQHEPPERQAQQDARQTASGSVRERVQELAEPVRKSLERPVEHVSRYSAWVQSLRVYRVVRRFIVNDGNLLSAGMSYRAIFAIFAALWVGFSITGFWLQGSPRLLRALVDIINQAVPGLIGPDGVVPQEVLLQIGATLGWTTLAAAVGLLWTATSWLNATRRAVRAMFDLRLVRINVVVARLGDFGLAIGFGIVLVIAAGVSVASANILTTILDWFGIQSTSFWSRAAVTVASFVIVSALNVVALGTMFRVLSRVAIPWRALLAGSVLGGVSLAVLSTISGLVLGGTSRNPLLASFTVFFGLLIWFNLVCRVILLSASWIAVGMTDMGVSARRLTPEQLQLERAAQEHSARMLVAEVDVERAAAELAHARGVGRMLARRRLARARAKRAELAADRVPDDGTWNH
jgi:membrane protein